MNKALIIALIFIALAMIIIGIKANILPPALTGIGFIIIAFLLKNQKR